MVNIFQNNTKTLPKKSANIVRVSMDELEIGGRKGHLPKADENDATIAHVPNQGKE